MVFKYFLLFVLIVLYSIAKSYGQGIAPKDDLLKLTAKSDSLTKTLSPEKLYLQTDKPYYAIGDTIWFKAYLLNSSYLTASNKSGILYVDIANDTNKVIKQYRWPVKAGLSWGNIGLSEKEFKTGTYIIRAYTIWMRNSGDQSFFYKRFYIGSAAESNLLVITAFKSALLNGAEQVNAKLLVTDINKIPFAVKELQLQVKDGNRNLYKQKLQTGVDGSLNFNFSLPQKQTNLAIILENEQKDKKAIIPVVLNKPENIDVQFLPEGGSLIAGLPATIGFKAIGENGKGIDVSGVILDQDKKQVAEFKSLKNGMGNFYLGAGNSATYTAEVTLANGTKKTFALPTIKKSGTILQIKNELDADSIKVSVMASDDISQLADSYFLIGKARGIICYAAIINFKEGGSVSKKIAKSLFPTGIAHFTLMTVKAQPLNERLTFIDHQDELSFQFEENKADYSSRDSIAVNLKVADNTGKPVACNLSLVVTDDTQVKADSLQENIVSRFLLTSDLKGYVEHPGYYFQSKNKKTWEALDNLLLTQGWIGYNWQEVINPPLLKFEAEHDFKVSGTVNNVFNKPLSKSNVVLLSKTPALVLDTVTNSAGRFIFNNLPASDTAIFVLQARNKRGNSFNVSINVDEITPPIFAKPVLPLMQPWYVNSDTTLLNFNKTNARAKQLQYFAGNDHLLKEVKITAKKIIKDSQNLNGPGNADIVIDEEELEAAGKKNFLQLFEEKIKGFHETVFRTPKFEPEKEYNEVLKFEDYLRNGYTPAANQDWYFIYTRPIVLILDGIDIKQMFPNFNFDDFRSFMLGHSAEDIKGIEVNTSPRYVAYYLQADPVFNSAPLSLMAHREFAFVEVTTRSGSSAAIKYTPGTYLYKPLPLSVSKQFYRPRYTVTDTSKHIPDLRSTIHWEPNVVTDKNGEATVSFYAADKPGTYTITIEGSDMNGNLGRKTVTIKIKNK